MRTTRIVFSWLPVLLLTLGAANALAQGYDGTLRGIVKDTTGAVIAGATVTVVNDDTQVSRTVNSERDGVFTVPNLLVGKYTVTIEMQGFKKYVRGDIQIKANQIIDLVAALQVGEVST